MGRDSTFNLRVTKEEKGKLDDLAAARGVSASDVVRLYIHEAHKALEAEPKTKAKKAGRK